MSQPIKQCSNCAYRYRGDWFMNTCGRTGAITEAERSVSGYPGAPCDQNFSGWAPRPSLLQRLRAWVGV